jgi:hypothetical protein
MEKLEDEGERLDYNQVWFFELKLDKRFKFPLTLILSHQGRGKIEK